VEGVFNNMQQVIKIHEKDNLLVALKDLSKGDIITFNGEEITLQTAVEQKHKFTTVPVAKGEKLYMYGIVVGTAMFDLPKGEKITVENTVHAAEEYKGYQGNYQWDAPEVSKWKDKTFNGFHRSNGAVGTANYWIFVPMVFCENRNLEVIKKALIKGLGYDTKEKYVSFAEQLVAQYKGGADKDALLSSSFTSEDIPVVNPLFPNIDGIKFLTHHGGCGGTRQDSDALCALLAGYVNHPNVAGVTVLSLGCQHAQVDIMKDFLYKSNPSFDKPMLVFEQQKAQSEEQLIEDAIKQTFVELIEVNKQERQPAPLSKLAVGLECGGSDGFSGISANPMLGYVSDMLVELGAATMLAEFPELCGVEQEIIDRCETEDIANKFIKIQRAYEKKAEEAGSGFDMNPSPGNIKDGLITDAIKSAGAAKKGGAAPVSGVLDYTEQLQTSGLNLLCTPGNDVESTTALAASGANIILFTTGLGTPTGNPVTPVVKVASNESLVERMPEIIDLNAGKIITGEKSIPEMAEETIDYIIEVASGNKQTKAMKLGQDDFIPWKRGVSL